MLALAFVLPFVLGWIAPNDWWATHHLAFLPSPHNFLLFGIALGLILLGFIIKPKLNYPSRFSLNHWVVSLAISALFCLFCYSFPIASDSYGNARTFTPYLNQMVESLPEGFWGDLLNFKVEPGNGRWGVFHLFTLAAYAFNCSYEKVFLWVDAICGSLFVLVWLRLVVAHISIPIWQLALSLAGIASPFFLIFFGHIETYAPLYLILLGYFVFLVRAIETKKQIFMLPMAILLLLGMRFHALSYLIAPSFFLTLLTLGWQHNKTIKKLLTFKGLVLWLYIPACLVGLVLYFFILKDYNDPRFLDGDVPDIERLFLPIIAPEAPLDNYNLQSWNHIFDFLNAILHWSPGLLFIFVSALTLYRKKLSMSPTLSILLVTLILLISFLFMFNPLMSMPMDWDLFVFPTPLFMVLTLVIVKQIQHETLPTSLLTSISSLGILAIPLFAVNAKTLSLSYRQESVGVHVYKTYYAHSASLMLNALNMIPADVDLYLKRKEKLLQKLKPMAQVGVDRKYAELLTDDAIVKWKVLNQLDEAKTDFQKALYYSPDYYDNWYYLAQLNLEMGNSKTAHQNALQLLNTFGLKENPDVLRLLIKCALENDSFIEAEKYCENYLLISNSSDINLVKKILERLQANENVEELKVQLLP